MQQVVKTGKKSNCLEWSDNLFLKLYWLPLPRYKRPTNNELHKASEFFIYHYVHQSGELSDWRNTFQILLLGLNINHNNLPVYILANEDEKKAVDSEIQLPWNDATTAVPEYKSGQSIEKAENKWQAWCYSELNRGNIGVVSNYFGLISLFLCGQAVATATDVNYDFKLIKGLLKTKSTPGESSWPKTPLPGEALFEKFFVIFNSSEQFAKQLICRVTQRRLQIKQELPMELQSTIIEIQNAACYKRFEERGAGLWLWFCRAKESLNVSDETLLEMLNIIGEFEESVEALKSITPFVLKQQTWRIASLLRNKAYSNLCVKNIENLLTIAIFMVVCYNITDENDKIWVKRIFEFDRLKRDGLMIKAISVGQSLRRAEKFNTKSKRTNCSGETQQAVKTKKSKCLEWTDNVFVQLYWLPLPRYKRPTNNELHKASEFFIYHYVHESGKLSDWRNTLRILLLGLSINHNNLPVYILANEDEKKPMDSEIQLPWNDAKTMVPLNNRENRTYRWQNWCYYELRRGNIAEVSNYLGRISLFFCSLAVSSANDVRYNFKRINRDLEEKFSAGDSSWPLPAWPSEALFQKFLDIFNCNTQFAKELICRLVQRRLQLKKEWPRLPKEMRRMIIKIQYVACYKRFEERGAGLWRWFRRAKTTLKVSQESLLDRLSVMYEFEESVEALRSIKPFDRNQETWSIASLLRENALCINNIENLLMIATCYVIVYNITSKDNKIWTKSIFAFDRLKQEGLLGKALSMGQSLRHAK